MRKVDYHYSTAFELKDEQEYTEWIIRVSEAERVILEHLAYTFCSDDQILKMNQEFLNHDYYTDILTFPAGSAKGIAGDIFISVDRVRDNAQTFSVSENSELKRVMIHGVLHLCGYTDATKEEQRVMREKEDRYIEVFHVKQ